MTITYNASGAITGFNYNDILNAYRSGSGFNAPIDMQTFMNSSASSFVKPTSFSAFAEVSDYVQSTGQSITIENYYLQKGAALGLTGTELTDYASNRATMNFQRYFDGDFSSEGLFNKFVYGSTSYKIIGEISPDGNRGTTYTGEKAGPERGSCPRVFDPKSMTGVRHFCCLPPCRPAPFRPSERLAAQQSRHVADQTGRLADEELLERRRAIDQAHAEIAQQAQNFRAI